MKADIADFFKTPKDISPTEWVMEMLKKDSFAEVSAMGGMVLFVNDSSGKLVVFRDCNPLVVKDEVPAV